MSTRSDGLTRVRFHPLGAARELFRRRDNEVVLSGPAGTGKTRVALEKVHLALSKYPGARALMTRKTHVALTATALQTYQHKVLHPLDGVEFYGGSAIDPPQFRYPNGSKLMMGGMDKPAKIMSSEYDIIYVNEATEFDENDWESLTTRLRNGVMPYQQLLGDCNPDAPHHWLKLRAESGKTVMLESRHEDNPTVTPEYLARLDALTGVRHLRLRLGLWAAAEGMVYEGWDRKLHLIDRIPVQPGTQVDGNGVPVDWPRYWAVDFGYTNPFVWQAWAEDPDGRLYRYREIYRTHRLVQDHVKDILAVTDKEPAPRAIICDHDAEDRATLERHLGMATVAAHKSVSPGIQAVASRLRVAGDGKPRMFLLSDALVEPDPELIDAKRPTCTEQEFESYVWDTSNNRKRGEQPVKDNDHGLDTTRYLVAQRDLVGDVRYHRNPWY